MAMKESEGISFSPELLAFIQEWKTKPGNLIMILHRVQGEFGYIPREAALKVSELLAIPLAKIYGVVSFYHFFKLTKPGKFKIQVCLGTACYLKGGQDVIDSLAAQLGIPIGGVTEDGLFSVEGVRCIGCCGLAPVMVVGDQVYGKVTKDQLPAIIQKFRG